jgi:transcriptional regulator with XRE-family HTH domain
VRKTAAVNPARRSPTVRRRRLARQLAELREQAGLAVKDVARELEWAESTVYRMEAARRGVKPGDVLLLLDLYGRSDTVTITDEQRSGLLQLAKDSRKRGWWQPYSSGVPEYGITYVGLEAEASSLHVYHVELVDGLLQTEDYARELRRVDLLADPAETERWLALRAERQRRLVGDDPLRLWVVLNEAVLRRAVGGAKVMTGQLDRLLQAAAQPNVTLQVLPFGAGAYQVMETPFIILDFPEPADQDVVYLEQTAHTLYIEEPDQVDWYKLAFDHLQARSLDPDQSVDLIRAARNEYS